MTLKQIIVAVVVALLVSGGVSLAVLSHASSASLGAASGGAIRNVPDFYTNGIGIGDQVEIHNSITIQAGSNQASWHNTTGRAVIAQRTELGYLTGTASTSLLFYVATSSTPTVANYVRPTGTPLLIDGVTIATSTPGNTIVVGTTTAAQLGVVIPSGAYLVFDVQSKNGAACNGAACEAATSTNRGISKFVGYFTGHYVP